MEDKAVDSDSSVQILRFANRVPLQFDRSSCAIVHAIESVNWRAYGIVQSKNSVPQGPYIVAVSVVSPFIKFKNASKETIDGSEELVEEIRRALIQGGQKLSRHIRREAKANELEEKIRHIEQFCPILIEGLCRMTHASAERRKKAEDGLVKILGRDAHVTKKEPRSRSRRSGKRTRGRIAHQRGYSIMPQAEHTIPKLSKDLCNRLLTDLERGKRPVLYATKCSLDNAIYNHKNGYLTPGDKKVATELNVNSVKKMSRAIFILEILLRNIETGAVNTKRELYYVSKGEIKHNPLLRPLGFCRPR